MASHKSAIKQNRKDIRRRESNRADRSTLRTVLRNVRAAISSGKPEEVRPVLKKAIALLDRKASKKIIHPNAAARTKSRLMLQARKLTVGA